MTMMPDHKTFRNYVKIVEDKLEKGEYLDYDHTAACRCVVGKALTEALGREPRPEESHLFVGQMANESLQRLFFNTSDQTNQSEGARKARKYLAETADLETV